MKHLNKLIRLFDSNEEIQLDIIAFTLTTNFI